jgi:hypothetical protein
MPDEITLSVGTAVGSAEAPTLLDGETDGMALPDGDNEPPNLVGTMDGMALIDGSTESGTDGVKLPFGTELGSEEGRELNEGSIEGVPDGATLPVGTALRSDEGSTLMDGETDDVVLPDGDNESPNLVGHIDEMTLALGEELGSELTDGRLDG